GGMIEGNLIGTDATGAAALGAPPDDGIVLDPPAPGTGVSILGNVIRGGTRAGISIGSQQTAPHTTPVRANFVGTDVTGTASLGNPRSGIFIASTDIIIGG